MFSLHYHTIVFTVYEPQLQLHVIKLLSFFFSFYQLHLQVYALTCISKCVPLSPK